ncbi:MAG: nucleoside transporter [Verrucomicrobiales bacterium]|jgi:nucleoside transporter
MSDSIPSGSAKPKLCIMMFLQFFIWGVWYVPMYPFLSSLGIAPEKIGFAYGLTGIAAMVSPILVGLIADKFFPSQIVLGVLHLIGGAALFMAAQATDWASFFPYIFIHLLCYMPTLALVNSVLFQSVADPEKDAPPIRTLGTLGWIASGIAVGGSFLLADKSIAFQLPQFLGGPPSPEGATDLGSTNWPLFLGAGASIILGLFCFLLPNTPPKLKGQKTTIGDLIGLKAIRLMKDPSFAVFIVCSLLICIPLSFYYQTANGYLKAMGVGNSEGVLTLGQVSEIFFLLLVPFFFKKIGVKNMLLIGMAFWVIRYLCFATGGPDAHLLLFLGVISHGICYDFFFFTGQLYVDKRAPNDIRSSAQGFIAFVTLGVGMFIGANVNGWWNGKQTTGTGDAAVVNWPAVWYFPAIMAAIVLVAFFILFKDKSRSEA